MKIAVVTWLVNDVGGINSWTENFIHGLRQSKLHTVDLFYSTHQSRLNCDPQRKVPRSRRYHLLPANHLPYTPAAVGDTVKTLNKYDLIVFAHPSPHPTKAAANCKHATNWQHLYFKTKPPKISVFHDRHWDRTNPWIENVRGSIDYVHAAQRHFIPAVKRFCNPHPTRHNVTSIAIPYDWGYFPLVLPKELPRTKRRRWILATQWLALKKHAALIPHLMELKLPLHSYGSGQTYHKLLPTMRQVYFQDFHYDEVLTYNKNSKHIHFGHTEYKELLRAMAESWFSIDLSIQGMTNMTHWEPMTVGTISVMERRVSEDEHCQIPSECCLQFDLDTLVEDMNNIGEMLTTDLLKIQSRAWDFIQQTECTKIALDLLSKAGF